MKTMWPETTLNPLSQGSMQTHGMDVRECTIDGLKAYKLNLCGFFKWCSGCEGLTK